MKIINGMKMYSTEDLAALLGIGVPTVTKYRREGKIKATRIGKGFFFSETALNEYLEGSISPKVEKQEMGKQVY